MPVIRVRSAYEAVARRWRQSLVLSLTVMGIAAIALLGFITSTVVSRQIRNDALSRARSTAEILARSTFAPRLPAAGEKPDRRTVRALDSQLATARAVQGGTEAALFSPTGAVLYRSSGADTTPAGDPPKPGTHVVRSGGGRHVRSVLPVSVRGSSRPAAYLQLDGSVGPGTVAPRLHLACRNLV